MNVLKPFEKVEKTIKKNVLIEREVINAFRTRDINDIEKHLAEKGIFYGNNKTIFIAQIQYLFQKYESCSCSYLFGNSIGKNSSNKVHEFVYTKEESTPFDQYTVISSMSFEDLQMGKKLKKNQFGLQMIFNIENDEIVSIVKPTKYLNYDEFIKASKEN